jgi:hypothetical protein
LSGGAREERYSLDRRSFYSGVSDMTFAVINIAFKDHRAIHNFDASRCGTHFGSDSD